VASILGLEMGSARFIGYYGGKEDAGRVAGSVVTSIVIGVPLALLAATLVYVNAGWLSTVFGEPALQPLLPLFAVLIPLMAFFRLVMAFLRGVGNARYKVYTEDLLRYGSILAAVLFFVSRGLQVRHAIYAYVAGFALVCAVGVYYVRSVFPYRLRDSRFIPGELLTFAWPLLVVSIIGVLNSYLDVLMLGWLVDSVRVGIYEVAISLASILYMFRMGGQYMFLPAVSELYAEEAMERISELYSTVTRWVATLALPVTAGFLLFPADILQLLLGTEYLPGTVPLALLSVGVFLSAVVGPADMVLLATGRTKQLMAAVVAFAAVDAMLNLLLIPMYGMVGAAVAMTAGFLAAGLLSFMFVRRDLGMTPASPVYPRLLAGVLLAAAPVYAASTVLDPAPVLSVLLGIVFLAIYFTAVERLGCIEKEEKTFVRDAAASVWRG
ncbi:MAG: flippase, partial [Candidatus Nanohaloarchaea archaeon]